MRMIPENKIHKTTKGFRLSQYAIENLNFLVFNTGKTKSDIVSELINEKVEELKSDEHL